MEQKNSQDLKKIFSEFIYDPTAITAKDSEVLEGLVNKYPYSQLLRAFYSRSLVESNPLVYEKELIKAALISTNGVVLQAIIEDPLFFKGKVTESEFTETAKESSNPYSIKGESATERSIAGNIINESYDVAQPDNSLAELAEPIADITSTDEPEASVSKVVSDEAEEIKMGNILETGQDNQVVASSELKVHDEENVKTPTPETLTEEPEESEIGNILATETGDQGAKLSETQEESSDDLTGSFLDSQVNDAETSPSKTVTDENEVDLLIKQSAASSDFLKEEKLNSVIDRTEDVFTPEVDLAEKISHNAVIEDHQKVSRYDDDKMPYSFLWWLSKTRKEHSDNYQPYVSFQLDTSQSIKRNTVDQLSSQIIENIFHLQSPVDDLENAPKTVPFQVKRKEDFILEKFIREEPQIKPPNSEKLDNENKARKSAEDSNDLVSETLAQIYTDQMLFHKAIDTYKKLSLKFPEKSTYFADQIRGLEKKLN